MADAAIVSHETYDALADEAADNPDIESGDKLPGAAFARLRRASSRASLLFQENGIAKEQWSFDEDAYTLSLSALYSQKTCWPYVLISMATALLQLCIVGIVMMDLRKNQQKDLHGVTRTMVTAAQVICTGLCLLQLSDEGCEGLHKLTFALRWYAGVYDGPAYSNSSKVAVMLSTFQVGMGVITCCVCIRVVFSAESALDTFFNYVALAFISDLDNMVMRSRMIRGCLVCEPNITAYWRPPEQQLISGHWNMRMAMVVNAACFLMILALNLQFLIMWHVFMSDEHIEWIDLVVHGIPTLCLLNSIMWFGTRQCDTFATALFLNLFLFSLTLLDYLLKSSCEFDSASNAVRCGFLKSCDQLIMWVFALMALPTAGAVVPKCFQTTRVFPFIMFIQIAMAMMFVDCDIHDDI